MNNVERSLQQLLSKIKQLEDLGLTNTLEYEKVSEEYQCLAMCLVEDQLFDEE